MKNLRALFFTKFVSSFTIFVLLAVIIIPLLVNAASFTASKDTMTRTKISTTADHIITFTLPGATTFDVSGNTDTLRVDFPHSSAFTQSGTWVTGDFTFTDGSGGVVSAVSQGSGIIDCTPTGGTDDVCVAIDTDNHIFTIEPGASYTASGAGATITFTIDGTVSDGTLTNPSSAASYAVDFAMCDETASCTSSFTTSHSSQIGLGINDDDQVTVTATVNASLTFDLDTESGGGAGESSAPYSVAFGTVPTSSVRVSGATDSVQMIVAEADTNASSGVVVTVQNANGIEGLVSTSVTADDIDSADGTMAAGTENYGLCVATATLSGFTAAGGYSGDTCAVNSETNVIEGLTSSPLSILSTTGPVAAAHAEIIANAAVAGTTVAHTDYTDTLTFIATGTF